MSRSVMAFRLRNLKYLVTWPQANQLSIDLIYEHLRNIEEIEYCVICEELHEDEHPHYHAYVQFAKKLNSRRNLFTIEENVANVKVVGRTNADVQRCIAYVKKDGIFREYGERPESLRKLQRIEKIQFIKEHTIKECVESGNFSISEIKNLDYVKSKMVEQRPDRERIVYWFHGDTGTGKTREAWRIAKEAYTTEDIWYASGNQRDFKNGYTGQRCVILDDFRNGNIAFNELLVLTDRYPCIVNVKGGYCNWMADLIIITCPFTPQETFVKRSFNGELIEREDIGQIIRRITEIRQFP